MTEEEKVKKCEMRVEIFRGYSKRHFRWTKEITLRNRGWDGRQQADWPQLCVCVHASVITWGKRTGEYARHAEATNQPNPSFSLLACPLTFLSHSRNELTSITYAGDRVCGCVCVCVCVCKREIVYLWQNMDEEMEMRELQSSGLSHTGCSNG